MRLGAALLLTTLALAACGPMPGGAAGDASRGGDAVVATEASAPDASATQDASGSEGSVAADAGGDFAAVQGLFAQHCGGYCHAGGTDVGSSLVLSPEHGATQVSSLRRASRQVPRLQLVEPGAPERSYLLHKLDGTMHTLPECAADPGACGESMPLSRGGPLLSVQERELVRRWIADGAPGAQ